MIAAHLGIANEDEINNMSLPFFNDVLAALGRRLNYESVSNLYGNSFCKDASKYIQQAYPLTREKKISSGFADVLSSATVIKAGNSAEAANAGLNATFGDTSWAEGLI